MKLISRNARFLTTSNVTLPSRLCIGANAVTDNMDDDIEDILNSVSRPAISDRKLDLQALTRAWVNERTCQELLPYPSNLVERVMDRLKRQV